MSEFKSVTHVGIVCESDSMEVKREIEKEEWKKERREIEGEETEVSLKRGLLGSTNRGTNLINFLLAQKVEERRKEEFIGRKSRRKWFKVWIRECCLFHSSISSKYPSYKVYEKSSKQERMIDKKETRGREEQMKKENGLKCHSFSCLVDHVLRSCSDDLIGRFS